MTTFAKAISEAAARPEGAPAVPGDLFSMSSFPAGVPVETIEDDPRVIPGVTKYPYRYNCQRFYIGKVLEAIDESGKVFSDRDDSHELCTVMETITQGRAMLYKRLESILVDGSVVIWLEWLVPDTSSAAFKPSEPGTNPRLTPEQLLSPERITPESVARDRAERAAAFGEAVPEAISEDPGMEDGGAGNADDDDDW